MASCELAGGGGHSQDLGAVGYCSEKGRSGRYWGLESDLAHISLCDLRQVSPRLLVSFPVRCTVASWPCGWKR